MAHHGKNHNNGIPPANLPGAGSVAPNATNFNEVASPAEGGANPTHRVSPNELYTQANRPTGPGAGIHRGDRRDTHPSYTTGKAGRGSTAGKARDGGRSGPLGASSRKSGPKAN